MAISRGTGLAGSISISRSCASDPASRPSSGQSARSLPEWRGRYEAAILSPQPRCPGMVTAPHVNGSRQRPSSLSSCVTGSWS